MKNKGDGKMMAKGYKEMGASGGKSSDHVEEGAYAGMNAKPGDKEKTSVHSILYQGHKGANDMYSHSAYHLGKKR